MDEAANSDDLHLIMLSLDYLDCPSPLWFVGLVSFDFYLQHMTQTHNRHQILNYRQQTNRFNYNNV